MFRTIIIYFCLIFQAFALEETILVTAATGELGKAVSEKLAQQGFQLILAARNEAKLKELQNQLHTRYKTNIKTVLFDYKDLSSIQATAKQLKSINGMVLIPPRPYFANKKQPEASEWSNNFAETFIAPLEFIKAIDRKELNSVVIISGTSSKYYMRDYPNTNVLRLVWNGEIKNLCHQYSAVRFNAVSPGLILTEHNKNKIKAIAKKNNHTYEAQLAEETSPLPSKRYGEAVDVANLVHFLLTPAASHINCENIAVDGGANLAY